MEQFDVKNCIKFDFKKRSLLLASKNLMSFKTLRRSFGEIKTFDNFNAAGTLAK